MKKPVYILIVFLALGLTGFAFLTPKATYFNTQGPSDNYKIHALAIPQKASFAGEEVDLTPTDLKERMDKELLVNTYWQSNTLLMIKRANKYFPQIEKILKEEGVPDDFKYLALIESGLEQVISPAGAKGFWQIMRATGKEMGLEINSNVDERYNIELSTRVACQYLKKAKEKLGTWTLAAASYNRGISGIKRLLEKQQVDNYYDLLLGSETKRYVFRILAVKAIVTQPDRFGFIINSNDLYPHTETKTIAVDTAITNIARFAKSMNMTYKEFKLHNPWLIQNHLNNKSRKLYHIKLPVTATVGP